MTDSFSPVTFHHRASVDPVELADNQIILTTLNAKYTHASLGLRYLYANMGALKNATMLREFTINQRPIDIAESLLEASPQIIGFGVYIWNVKQTEELISLIKTIAPHITIIIGGPEVSFEYQHTSIFAACDFLITGQADFAFTELCTKLILEKNATSTAAEKVITAVTPAVNQLALPYAEYSDEDLKNRIIYVEASRGCPFKCEFCLSSLDKTAYPFDLNNFLQEMAALYDRGARRFKFVDRTFNLKIANCVAILEFFLIRAADQLFLHFEVIPDKLPDALKTLLRQFPEGSLQFEIGIQSFNPLVQKTINRAQNNKKSSDNLHWLRKHTHAYIHADLIFGLPGESLESFATGFDALVSLDPQEIQVGILKRLRGTPIATRSAELELHYSPGAPYQLLCSRDINFNTMQRMQRFSRYWDLIANSGRFTYSKPLILGDQPFDRFMQLSDWLFAETGQTHRIALLRLMKLVHTGLVQLNFCNDARILQALTLDCQANGEKRVPGWMDKSAIATNNVAPIVPTERTIPARQSRRLGHADQ